MDDNNSTVELTRFLAEFGRGIRLADVPGPVLTRAKHSLLDILGLILAGSRQDTARIVRQAGITVRDDGAATVLGTSGQRASVTDAALANGTAAHALDYDDGGRLIGHASCTLVPAVLAVAESADASGAELLAAMISGYETAGRVAALVGPAHYNAGFHSTATFGTFSCAAATAHLLGLSTEQWVVALGIAASAAAGLRANFGTMAKPFHAGRAASAGVLASRLAAAGFTANPAVGAFATTHTTTVDEDAARRPFGAPYVTDDLHYKYHAACDGTHAAIDGVVRLREQAGVGADQVASVLLRVPALELNVCNIQQPRTGLEAKFSLKFTAAAALLGWDTTEGGFTAEAATDPRAVRVMERVTVQRGERERGGPTEVELVLTDGRRLTTSLDTRLPWTDLDAEWAALSGKFRRLSAATLPADQADATIDQVRTLDLRGSARELLAGL